MSSEMVKKWWVTVSGYSPILCCAATAAKARYVMYLQYSDAYTCRFVDFLQKSTVIRADDSATAENGFIKGKGWGIIPGAVGKEG